MSNKDIKKIKGQKNVALIMMVGPAILLIGYLSKTDFEKHVTNNYIICAALIVLIIVGFTAFKRSSHKLKSLRNK